MVESDTIQRIINSWSTASAQIWHFPLLNVTSTLLAPKEIKKKFNCQRRLKIYCFDIDYIGDVIHIG